MFGLLTFPSPNCGTMTYWSRSTLPASIPWILRSDGDLKPLLPYKLPIVLGNDLAGTVIKAGPGVHQFKPGDEVYAKPDKDRIGAFAS